MDKLEYFVETVIYSLGIIVLFVVIFFLFSELTSKDDSVILAFAGLYIGSFIACIYVIDRIIHLNKKDKYY